jgi:hypothetical protein
VSAEIVDIRRHKIDCGLDLAVVVPCAICGFEIYEDYQAGWTHFATGQRACFPDPFEDDDVREYLATPAEPIYLSDEEDDPDSYGYDRDGDR